MPASGDGSWKMQRIRPTCRQRGRLAGLAFAASLTTAAVLAAPLENRSHHPAPSGSDDGVAALLPVPEDAGVTPPVSLSGLVDLSALGQVKIELVDHLPPDKTGMTTGEGADVRIFINRRYPLFIQYSTLTHELVHAKDRQARVHRRFSRAEREYRALAAELSPENLGKIRKLATSAESYGSGMLKVFLQDVASQHRYYKRLAALELQERRAAEARVAVAYSAPQLRWRAPGVYTPAAWLKADAGPAFRLWQPKRRISARSSKASLALR